MMILATLALSVAAISAAGSTSPVVHAEAPPDGALLGVFATDVHVRVQVAEDGHVTSATAVNSPPFVGKLCEDAALAWQFAPLGTAHTQEITFEVKPPGATDLPSYLYVEYMEPLRMTVRRMRSVVAPLSAEENTDSRCPIHGESFRLGVVPIQYGLPASVNAPDAKREYRRLWRARQKLFPKAAAVYTGGCTIGEYKFAEVTYCLKCRRARLAWLREHPHSAAFE